MLVHVFGVDVTAWVGHLAIADMSRGTIRIPGVVARARGASCVPVLEAKCCAIAPPQLTPITSALDPKRSSTRAAVQAMVKGL